MEDDLQDLVRRDAEAQGGLDVRAQLVGAIEPGKQPDGHQAAGLQRQSGPRPDVAESDGFGQLAHLRLDRQFVARRRVGVAQHALPERRGALLPRVALARRLRLRRACRWAFPRVVRHGRCSP